MPEYSTSSLGYAQPAPPPPGEMPPGGGRYAVPHQFSFSSIFNNGQELYRYYFDEAVRHSRENALAMRRDCVIYHAVRARQMPTAELAWHLDPEDETDPAQVECAQGLTKILERMPRWVDFNRILLEAIWYGRYAAQVVYRWDYSGGSKKLIPVDHLPVNGDKIRFKWGGQAGLYVHPMFPGTMDQSDLGMVHWLTPDERQQFVIHRHEPDDADIYEGEFAGQVNGVGLRSRLYWFWWLKTNVYALMMNYLERFANGLTIVNFEAGNPEAKAWADDVATAPFSRLAVTVPSYADRPDVNKVTRLEVGTATPALLQDLITDYFDKELRRAILGQDLTSDTAPTGLGSGVAEAHTETLSRIVKYDALNLQDTIQTDLVNVLARWNYPGVTPPRFKFEVDDPNAADVLGYAQILYQLGYEIDLDHLAKIARLPKAKPGASTASVVSPMQAAAVGQPGPAGVPQAGAGGPDPNAQAVPAASQAMQGPPQGGQAAPVAMRRRKLARRKVFLATSR